MQWLTTFAEHQDYIGVAIGTILLIISGFFLPSSIRKYVWTAGFAVIIYRFLQITINKKKMAEADKERKQLRGQHAELQKELDEHKAELAKLNQQLDAVRQERNKLADRANLLAKDKASFEAEKESLNNQLVDIKSRNNDLIEKVDAREKATSAIDRTIKAIEHLDKAFPD